MVRRKGPRRDATGKFIRKGGKSETPVSDMQVSAKVKVMLPVIKVRLNDVIDFFITTDSGQICNHTKGINRCLTKSMLMSAFLKEIEVRQVDPALLKYVINVGDTLHTNFIENNGDQNKLFSIERSCVEFCDNIYFNIEALTEDDFFLCEGIIDNFHNFSKLLVSVFKNNNICILTLASKSVCLYHQTYVTNDKIEIDMFGIFNSHSIQSDNLKQAYLKGFLTISLLAQHIFKTFKPKKGQTFSFTNVKSSVNDRDALLNFLNADKMAISPQKVEQISGSDVVMQSPDRNVLDNICNLLIIASRSQDSSEYLSFSRNKQCTPNSGICCALLSVSDVINFSSKLLDLVLDTGDDFYRKYIEELRGQVFFSVDGLYFPREFKIRNGNREISFTLQMKPFDENFTGVVYGNFREIDEKFDQFFSSNSEGVLTFSSKSFCVFSQHNCYGLFDPHNSVAHGTKAYLQMFSSLNSLISHIRSQNTSIYNSSTLFSLECPILQISPENLAQLQSLILSLKQSQFVQPPSFNEPIFSDKILISNIHKPAPVQKNISPPFETVYEAEHFISNEFDYIYKQIDNDSVFKFVIGRAPDRFNELLNGVFEFSFISCLFVGSVRMCNHYSKFLVSILETILEGSYHFYMHKLFQKKIYFKSLNELFSKLINRNNTVQVPFLIDENLEITFKWTKLSPMSFEIPNNFSEYDFNNRQWFFEIIIAKFFVAYDDGILWINNNIVFYIFHINENDDQDRVFGFFAPTASEFPMYFTTDNFYTFVMDLSEHFNFVTSGNIIIQGFQSTLSPRDLKSCNKVVDEKYDSDCIADSELQLERGNRDTVDFIDDFLSRVRVVGDKIVYEDDDPDVEFGNIEKKGTLINDHVPPLRSRGRKDGLFAAIIGNKRNPTPFSIGRLTKKCEHCGALHFPKETRTTLCCIKGQIVLDDDPAYPSTLKDLLLFRDLNRSEHFMSKIVPYNNALSFISLRSNLQILSRSGPPVIIIHGITYHLYSNSAVSPNVPRYGQLYYLEASEAVQSRCPNDEVPLKRALIRELDDLLRRINPFAQAYMRMHELDKQGDVQASVIFLHNRKKVSDGGDHPGILCLPTGDEICAVFNEEGFTSRDMVIYLRGDGTSNRNRLLNVHIGNPNREALTYALLFPYGQQRWHVDLLSKSTDHPTRHVTCNEYNRYKMAIRENEFNPCHFAGKLYQLYVIDSHLSAQDHQLMYFYRDQTQKTILRDQYKDAKQRCEKRATDLNVKVGGIKTILPASFYGSERWYKEKYLNSMALVAEFGKPSLLITMTMNPNHPDLKRILEDEWNRVGGSGSFNHMNAMNRPDIVCRAFDLQVSAMIEDLDKKKIFGRVLAYTGTVEFQKRGLPHMHILIWIDESDWHSLDDMISAEIPNEEDDPELFRLVTSYMMHNRCDLDKSYSCRQQNPNYCSKNFPKPWSNETFDNVDGYPVYRRRKGCPIIKDRKGNILDSRYVVAYNPYLLKRYGCHVNVEYVGSIKAVAYVFKYIAKGTEEKVDTAMEVIVNGALYIDEAHGFRTKRYVSAMQGAYRLLGFPLQYTKHTFEILPVHLPDEQIIFYREDNEEAAVQRGGVTKLTAFFFYNNEIFAKENELREEVDSRRETYEKKGRGKKHRIALRESERELRSFLDENPKYFYKEFPKSHRYITDHWAKRKNKSHVVARLHFVSPSDQERFCLRLLLINRQSPRSFEDLRTVNGVVYDIFRNACLALNLLVSNDTWIQTLNDAASTGLYKPFRALFAYILLHNYPGDALQLWDLFKGKLSEDIATHAIHNSKIPKDKVEDIALYLISLVLQRNGSSLIKAGLPPTSVTQEDMEQWYSLDDLQNIGTHVETVFIPSVEMAKAQRMIQQLNDDQLAIFQQIKEAIDMDPNDSTKERLFFVQGAGGCGKSFLIETLLSYVRGKKETAIAAAWSGLAASLISGGTTLHSRFKLPIITVPEDSITCNINPTGVTASFIKKAKFIVIDEATLIFGSVLEAINNLCCDLDDNKSAFPFGGKIILLCGDFRQCLPIIKGGGRDRIIFNSLKHCPLWPMFKKLELTRNMRLQDNDTEFYEWQLKVGEGKIRDKFGGNQYPDLVEIKPQFIPETSIEDDIFGKAIKVSDDVSNRVILAPTLADVREINEHILNRLEGDKHVLLSEDSLLEDEDCANIDPGVEVLNSLTPSGMPLHKLELKIGAMVILLRNLNTAEGLCNGTRLRVNKIHDSFLECQIAVGSFSGNIHFIPRITLTSKENSYIDFKRIQFPVNLCYAMTINKSQGQSFDHVGVYFRTPPFTHGQLYVAISRTRFKANLRIFAEDTPCQGVLPDTGDKMYVPNVVFKEVFQR